MNIRKRLFLSAALPVFALGSTVMSMSAASAAPAAPSVSTAFGGCDFTTPPSTGVSTLASNTVDGRLVELRYSKANRCAWGRISGGIPGDQIWVDRSFDGGRTWTVDKLGFTTIKTGQTAHTAQFDDTGVVMRACGSPGNGHISCTTWR